MKETALLRTCRKQRILDHAVAPYTMHAGRLIHLMLVDHMSADFRSVRS